MSKSELQKGKIGKKMRKSKRNQKSYSGIDFGFIDRKGARLFFILQIFLISVSVIGVSTAIWGLFDKNIESKGTKWGRKIRFPNFVS